MSGSGEHRIELADTDPCPEPWFDSEHERETWPKIEIPRAPNLGITTDLLDGPEIER